MVVLKYKKSTIVNLCVNQPIFSESIIETNFYSELQRNGWCEVIDDKPEKLLDWMNIKVLKNKKVKILHK